MQIAKLNDALIKIGVDRLETLTDAEIGRAATVFRATSDGKISPPLWHWPAPTS